MSNKKTTKYKRLSVHTIDEVFAIVGSGKLRFPTHQVNTDSDRLLLFKEKGCDCVNCGAKGKFFALEKEATQEKEVYHYNLYAEDCNGGIVLMTKDHIIPRSRGGKNLLSNYQPMCLACNNRKGNTMPYKSRKEKKMNKFSQYEIETYAQLKTYREMLHDGDEIPTVPPFTVVPDWIIRESRKILNLPIDNCPRPV